MLLLLIDGSLAAFFTLSLAHLPPSSNQRKLFICAWICSSFIHTTPHTSFQCVNVWYSWRATERGGGDCVFSRTYQAHVYAVSHHDILFDAQIVKIIYWMRDIFYPFNFFLFIFIPFASDFFFVCVSWYGQLDGVWLGFSFWFYVIPVYLLRKLSCARSLCCVVMHYLQQLHIHFW